MLILLMQRLWCLEWLECQPAATWFSALKTQPTRNVVRVTYATQKMRASYLLAMSSIASSQVALMQAM